MALLRQKTEADPSEPRIVLIEELYRRYGTDLGPAAVSLKNRARYLRKKYAWILIVGGAQFLKRLLDFCAGAGALVVLSPLFAVVALSIKATDGGSVLFWQKRVGQYGREFRFPKFRSMVVNAEALKKELMKLNQHKEGVTFKMKSDPRITWIGKIIRRLSIDEMPQLWCVLIGDMSLVGPRPPVPSEIVQYTLAQRRRLDVVPGLTCIWQVSGRSDIPFPRQAELDVQYIESQSLWLDIRLLLKTIPAVLSGRGAY